MLRYVVKFSYARVQVAPVSSREDVQVRDAERHLRHA
jgi:hypothetical protein